MLKKISVPSVSYQRLLNLVLSPLQFLLNSVGASGIFSAIAVPAAVISGTWPISSVCSNVK